MRVPRVSLVPLVVAAALSVAGCATRHPENQVPFAPVAPGIVWRVEPGDIVKTRIYREPELSGEAVVAPNGQAYFAGVGRVAVAGMTLDSLQMEIAARYSKLVLDAAVEVMLIRDVVVYGDARSPGVYPVDASTTVLGLLAKGGGATGASKTPSMTLMKADGRQLRLPREARMAQIDVRHGDAVYVTQDSFFARNAQNFTVFSTVVTVLVSVAYLISFATK
jgi:protein involved in polysaccharide export with SLBB domain